MQFEERQLVLLVDDGWARGIVMSPAQALFGQLGGLKRFLLCLEPPWF